MLPRSVTSSTSLKYKLYVQFQGGVACEFHSRNDVETRICLLEGCRGVFQDVVPSTRDVHCQDVITNLNDNVSCMHVPLAPFLAKVWATIHPMPVAPPVIKATRPLTSNTCCKATDAEMLMTLTVEGAGKVEGRLSSVAR